MPHSLDFITAFHQLVSRKTSSDFIILVSVHRDTFFKVLMPLFDFEQNIYNFGSPFRGWVWKQERPLQMNKTKLLDLTHWLLTSSATQYSLCPLFGITKSIVVAWLYCGLEEFFRLCLVVVIRINGFRSQSSRNGRLCIASTLQTPK